MTTLRKALFLDRDGVLIDYVPYLSRPEQVQLPVGAGAALRQWQAAGYLLIVITNQAGIGRGYFDQTDVEAVHQRIRQDYDPWGVTFTDFFLCPHHPDAGCDCRKPSPQMLLKAAQQYGLSLQDSYFVGDAPSDLQAAINARCQPVLVLTGRGQESLGQLDRFSQPIPVFESLCDTVALLSSL